MNTVRSAFIWAAIAGLVVFGLPLMALVRLFDRDPAHYRTGRLFRWLGSQATRVNPFWTIRVEGEVPADPRHPYVVVANHQSLADIPVISRLPWEMKWVVKAELFRVPLFGWMMRLAGDIPVDRKDTTSRARVLQHARRYLGDRCSVMFFPEGTRSKDARVRRFQAGAFRLAIEAGVPVLPLAVDGTSHAIPKHGWRFGERIQARLRALEPIPTAGLTAEDAPALAEQARRQILDQIAAWRGVAPETVDALAEGPRARVEEPSKAP
ncbi:MAG: lysophospholipid acyltransferase family protein [Rhodothermales bacterium]|nr:lysophospholipid acyltransferase family protein [Rhodothermales bacterium]